MRALGFQWLEQAAREVGSPAPATPLVIADMGAAGGGNSLEPMQRAINAFRQVDSESPILVVHTDIAGNDFSSLFELVEHDPHTYQTAPGVFALAAGRSFYEPLFPSGFLSLGWSSIAVHWLSELPAAIGEGVHCSSATGTVRDALAAQSAGDWRAFLTNRATELRDGGRVIVVGGAATDDGASGAEGLMRLADAALRELVAAGEVGEGEYERMTIPTWNRTVAEFLEPFSSGELDGVLELRRHSFGTLPDAYFEAYERDGDLDRYSSSVAGYFRAAFGESLLAGLAGDDPKRRRRIDSRLEAKLRERIAADPREGSANWHVAVLDIAKPGP